MTEWYRFDDVTYSVCIDPDGDQYGSSTRVLLRKYRVISETKTGAWLDLGMDDKRFTRINSRKRFACPTIEEAKASYVARKKRQAAIYEARAAKAYDCIRQIEKKELW